MIHLPIMRWLLVAILPLGGLLVGLLRETFVGSARGTDLHGSVVMVSADHSATADVDYHSVAGMVDVASSSCDSID